MEPSKIETFFTGLFPKIILKNKIVATIVFNLCVLFRDFKIKVDNTINTDI